MTAPAHAVPVPARLPDSVPARPAPVGRGSLRLVPQRGVRPRRAPFLAVLVGVLALGLLGLLVLNTVLAQDSFRLHALQIQGKVLADREQELRISVEALQAPGALAERAAAQGMVDGGVPAFLRLPDGAVLGQPEPAASPSPPPTAASAVEVPADRPVQRRAGGARTSETGRARTSETGRTRQASTSETGGTRRAAKSETEGAGRASERSTSRSSPARDGGAAR